MVAWQPHLSGPVEDAQPLLRVRDGRSGCLKACEDLCFLHSDASKESIVFIKKKPSHFICYLNQLSIFVCFLKYISGGVYSVLMFSSVLAFT